MRLPPDASRLRRRADELAAAILRTITVCLALGGSSVGAAEAPAAVPVEGLTLTRWAREPQVADPVALAYDDQGVLYVAETARRSTVDIDIRSHREWLVEDLANQSVDDLRRAFHRWMAPEKSLENASWLPDYNHDGVHDWQDLQGVKERIRRLEGDRLKPGLRAGEEDRLKPALPTGAVRSVVFAEGFNEEISGVVAGVMPWGKDVWVTGYPDLMRLRDTDGDGRADVTETVFRGFGVHAAFDGHDLHGLTIGPEGKIYFSCGDNGFNVTNREGRVLSYPNTGGVLRMDPDGSNLEVYASGLRNPQEVAFDEYGNLFAVDNDGDLRDERERFVFIAEGSDSGWRIHWQFRDPGWASITGQPDYNPWVDERMWVPYHAGQPAHITPPITNYSVGPGSFKFNPGTALNDRYRGHFFLIQFPVQKVTAFQARPRGAGFEMVGEHTVLSGMMASAVNFSPDGALAVGDWDGMWAPNGTGGIWLLDDPKVAHSEVRLEVARLLSEGMTTRPVRELVRLLGHADQRIRLRAQLELVRREARAELLAVVRGPAPQLARVHGLWGLSRLAPPVGVGELPLSDPDVQVRALAAKVAGDLRLSAASSVLESLLRDPEPRVRFQAALALGKLSPPVTIVAALARMLEENGNQDPFLRHAAVVGLVGVREDAAIAALKSSASPSVRLGAVVALRRLRSPQVEAFLSDADAGVRREAVRAIHDDESIPKSLGAVAVLAASRGDDSDPAVFRRALNANLRLGGMAEAERLIACVRDRSRPADVRREALLALADWDKSPALDRVEGRVRVEPGRTAGLGRQVLSRDVAALLASEDPELSADVTRIVVQQRIPAPGAVFARWVAATNQSVEVRVRALEFLAQGNLELLGPALIAAGRDSSVELRIAALAVLAQRDPTAFLATLREREGRAPLQEQQAALRLAGTVATAESAVWLGRQLDAWNAGTLSPELALDVLEAARANPDPALRARVAEREARDAADGRSAQIKLLTQGGDPVRGERVFRTSVTGQCVRCHDAGGPGVQAGPVLNGIGARVNREYLLEALLDPSARLADGFATVSVTRKDGEVIEGLRLKETSEELTLRLADGDIRVVPVSQIQERSASTQSAMPPMTGVLTPREIRDVVAFLAQWR
ncbi:MAG: HEAT repeat domain-containing protein [Verrucomicrobiota bacterium]